MPRSTGTQTRTFVYDRKYLQSATNPENGTVNYTQGGLMTKKRLTALVATPLVATPLSPLDILLTMLK